MVRSFLARSSLRVVSEILGSASRPESLCLACRLRRVSPPVHASFSTSAARAESLSITERIRRKIWGTDQPPGQADPYARLDESEKAREAQARLVDEEKRKKAAAADELPDGYEPATTWDGLEEVGTFETVEEEWTRRHPYEGFMTATRLTTPQELTAALHRAVIEVYTLEEAGRPLSSLRKDPGSDDLTGSVQAAPSSDLQGATLVYPGDSVRVEILRSLSKESVNSKRSDDLQTSVASSKSPAGTEPVEPDAASIAIANEGASEASSESPEQRLDETTPEINQAENQISSWDPSWLSIPLKTVDLKFALVKRVMQLTGIRIPDPVIGRLHDVQSLHSHLVTPPKAKKLAHALAQIEQLTSLPNVSLHERRVTPIDKEKMVGRWKVIERELLDRGLPVTGNS